MTDHSTVPGTTPTWAWARSQQVMQAVETEPLEYHRLYRGAQGYRWWKPLVALLLATVFYFTISLMIGIVWGIAIMASQPDLFFSGDIDALMVEMSRQTVLDTQNPLSVLMSLLSIIAMIPSVILALLILGIRPTGRIWSAALRVRWGLLWRTFGLAVVGVIVMNVAGVIGGMIVDPAASSSSTVTVADDFSVQAAVVSMIFVLLFVPFQAAAEEVVFRGFFMQVLGSWIKNPWVGILLPSLGFALAHIYDIWGLLAVGAMGVCAAWLTWRTGGLEAAISIHVVNNLVAFGFMASGITGETSQTSDSGGPMLVVGEVIGLAVYSWLVLRSTRKHRDGRARIDVLQVPVPPANLLGSTGPAA